MHVEVKGGDLPGLKALMQRMESANQSVLVGVPAGATEEDGTSCALVLAVNIFGSPEHNIPARPVLQQGVRNGAAKFVRVNQDSLRRVVRGEMTVEQAVEKLGVLAVGEVKREFVVPDPAFVPNKPATIARKGSSRPMIASGQTRQSITYQIEGTQSVNAKVIE
jgi:hypothetical protein